MSSRRHWAAAAAVAAVAALVACGEPPTVVVEPLRIVSWAPNQGAQCVAALAMEFSASVTFSDDIDPDSLDAETLSVRQEGGDALPGRIAYDEATQTAQLTLSHDLEWGTVHELVASDAIAGASRGHLVAELRSMFVTVSRGGCF